MAHWYKDLMFYPIPGPGTEVIKLLTCSTQLSMKFITLMNVKMPTTVGILTFISKINKRYESFCLFDLSLYVPSTIFQLRVFLG